MPGRAASSNRFYVDEKDARPAVLPGTQSSTVSDAPPPPPPGLRTATQATQSNPSITQDNIPRTPPSPSDVSSSPPPPSSTTLPPTGTGTSSVASPPSPRRKKRRFRRFFLITLTTLGLAYAGGVYYSLTSDNFHDFFTEYILFGEDAVLYFEEREFKRRFGDRAIATNGLYPQTSGENKVTVSGRSGVSAKVSEEGKLPNPPAKPSSSSPPPKSSAPNDGLGKTDRAMTDTKGTKDSKPTASKPGSKNDSKTRSEAGPALKTETEKVETKKPDATRPVAEKPPPKTLPKIDTLSVENAADPIVQEISKILNDVITVVNADNASDKYSSTMTKAKEAVQKLASDVASYRTLASGDAEKKVQHSQAELEKQAQELLRRLEQEQRDQELKWREEYESERERLSRSYDDKVKAELEAAQKISDQKLKNELLEQNVRLTNSFSSSVRDRVETERSARLAKLQELSSSVSELDGLTSQWGEVVDANVKTQHLVVAVEAVRSVLESAERPKPFVHELAALKETADGNSVVNAAIASIHPNAYQRGIPTAAQLVDRFRGVASEVRKASLIPEDAGAASHAASFLLSKVLFKKQGLALGDDVESILTRTETLLEEGNLNDATREMNTLTGWAKVLSKDWLAECRRVLEVRQALDVIAAEGRLQSLLVQ
ncbi:MAG: Formation of crista junctions protein 1 [Chrysothrix sp. TS-e1954]|nr:MAG: Formation of crista junctions protein 1 [Chrysothrix sp. TS-e1954]